MSGHSSFGARSGANWLKYGKAFKITEAKVEALEQLLDDRPGTEPTISRNSERIVNLRGCTLLVLAALADPRPRYAGKVQSY
jgi:hypothetical protein